MRLFALTLFALGYVGLIAWFYIRHRNARHDAAHDFSQSDQTAHGEAE